MAVAATGAWAWNTGSVPAELGTAQAPAGLGVRAAVVAGIGDNAVADGAVLVEARGGAAGGAKLRVACGVTGAIAMTSEAPDTGWPVDPGLAAVAWTAANIATICKVAAAASAVSAMTWAGGGSESSDPAALDLAVRTSSAASASGAAEESEAAASAAGASAGISGPVPGAEGTAHIDVVGAAGAAGAEGLGAGTEATALVWAARRPPSIEAPEPGVDSTPARS